MTERHTEHYWTLTHLPTQTLTGNECRLGFGHCRAGSRNWEEFPGQKITCVFPLPGLPVSSVIPRVEPRIQQLIQTEDKIAQFCLELNTKVKRLGLVRFSFWNYFQRSLLCSLRLHLLIKNTVKTFQNNCSILIYLKRNSLLWCKASSHYSSLQMILQKLF